MPVMILCGGMGTRLREETEFLPKPMVEIGGRPMLWHIMKGYAARGFTDFILCLGYKGQKIREYFLHYEAMHCDFTIELGQRDRLEIHSRHNEADWRVTLVDIRAVLTAEHQARFDRNVVAIRKAMRQRFVPST